MGWWRAKNGHGDPLHKAEVGYLYAIAHGAQLIYDTDDDNEVPSTEALRGWVLKRGGARGSRVECRHGGGASAVCV